MDDFFLTDLRVSDTVGWMTESRSGLKNPAPIIPQILFYVTGVEAPAY